MLQSFRDGGIKHVKELVDSLAQGPETIVISSRAMSPRRGFPTVPSNTTCQGHAFTGPGEREGGIDLIR